MRRKWEVPACFPLCIFTQPAAKSSRLITEVSVYFCIMCKSTMLFGPHGIKWKGKGPAHSSLSLGVADFRYCVWTSCVAPFAERRQAESWWQRLLVHKPAPYAVRGETEERQAAPGRQAEGVTSKGTYLSWVPQDE